MGIRVPVPSYLGFPPRLHLAATEKTLIFRHGRGKKQHSCKINLGGMLYTVPEDRGKEIYATANREESMLIKFCELHPLHLPHLSVSSYSK